MEPGSLCRCLPILRATGSLLGKERYKKMLEWQMWRRRGEGSRAGRMNIPTLSTRGIIVFNMVML